LPPIQLRAGVVGLAANRLTEEFYRPSVVVELGELEAVDRAAASLSSGTHALDECAGMLTRYVGRGGGRLQCRRHDWASWRRGCSPSRRPNWWAASTPLQIDAEALRMN
jgi:hypothetical protein